MIASTTQRFDLTVAALVDYGRRVHGQSLVQSTNPDLPATFTFTEVANHIDRLSRYLADLDLQHGDVVASMCSSSIAHLITYLAVPSAGWVLETLNPRQSGEALAVALRADRPKVLVVDAEYLPLLDQVRPDLVGVEHTVVVDDGSGPRAGHEVPGVRHEFEAAINSPLGAPTVREIDEHETAVVCFTSGTTGSPKGVAYSHRCLYLHTSAICGGNVYGLTDRDRVLMVAPMYHANAWGLPLAAWISGADILLPGRDLSAPALAGAIDSFQVTVAAAVPTIWSDLLSWADTHTVDLGSLRLPVSGGSALPARIATAFEERHGIHLRQGWGLTETTPLLALANPPRGSGIDDDLAYRLRTGRIVPGVGLRLMTAEGTEAPWDDHAQGAIQVKGPWVTDGYLGGPAAGPDGWFDTGDVGRVDERGFVQITDRAKDLIKSGGEWISSTELEDAIRSHHAVAEVAVIGVPDERWQERPLACVVFAESEVDPSELAGALNGKVPRWWTPSQWSYMDALPQTAIGKIAKTVLKERFAAGDLPVVEAGSRHD